METQNIEENQNFTFTLSDSAVRYISNLKGKNQGYADKFFRVSVEGGGCSGYQYQYSFDSLRDKDIQIHKDGVTVVIDPLAKDLLNGSLLDYSDDFRNQGFSVSNPNATGTCGCGVSFSV